MTMSQGFQALIAEVDNLTDAISRGLGLAVGEAETRRVDRLANNPAYRSLGPGMGLRAKLQHGTHGFSNFGTGTPVDAPRLGGRRAAR